MTEQTGLRSRAQSHKEYVDSLLRPSAADFRRISDAQEQKEREIDRKYHTIEEYNAATVIQKAYRGHRERRQLEGLTLDPSSRWVELIKEWKYRNAIASQHQIALLDVHASSQSPSDVAKKNWKRVGQIAEHAGAGEVSPSRIQPINSISTVSGATDVTVPPISMLLDLRYFLEMVDQKHRYGTNLQVYHEEWQHEHTKRNFFDWLDHGPGKHLSLPGCSRARLDRERIRYLSREERRDYLVEIDDQGRLRWAKNNDLITTSAEMYKDSVHGIVSKDATDPPFTNDSVEEQQGNERCSVCDQIGTEYHSALRDDSGNDLECDPLHEDLAHQIMTKDRTLRRHFHVSPATILNLLLRKSIKPGTWIYVADTVGRLYVGIKSSGTFQHASFLAGARISSAGSIGIETGQLTYLSPLSGHYRPTTKSFRTFIDHLKEQDVDLARLKVSRAYEILLGMEYYGKTKASISRVVHHKKVYNPEIHSVCESDTEDSAITAAEQVDQHWQAEHKHGLAKLIDDLHIRGRSAEQKREPG